MAEMSAAIVYLGDELSAAGFRLAGVDARVPSAGAETDCLAAAMREASVVLLGIHCAASIPAAALEPALASRSPLVMVVPDLNGTHPSIDSASKVRRLLGVET
jgi:vacuolar-type H+-ATPase subunit F/Vma7